MLTTHKVVVAPIPLFKHEGSEARDEDDGDVFDSRVKVLVGRVLGVGCDGGAEVEEVD